MPQLWHIGARLWGRIMLDDDIADDIHPLFHGAPQSNDFKKLRKRIVRDVREAIETYGMIERGARWLVCLSGGKDSYTLLAILHELKWRGLLPVDLLACNLDQGQPNFPATVLPEFLKRMGVEHRIEYQDTYSVVTSKIAPGGTMCSLCSRLRRGNLYRIAREEGCSAVVLGHHRDDILETFFMNLFHGGRLATMPPKLAPFSARLIAMPRFLSNHRPSVLLIMLRLVPDQPNASTALALSAPKLMAEMLNTLAE